MAAVRPLIAIVGETASGKSSLAMMLAEQFKGEIICADSRTVYKGMDIGTAKPSIADQALVKHYGLDMVEPDEPFNAARFKEMAVNAIDEIHGRGHVPLLVGGTGLYIDAVVYDYAFLPPSTGHDRSRLNRLSVEELQAELTRMGVALPANGRNPRHLIRAIETNGAIPVRKGLLGNTLVLGMRRDKDFLIKRITERVDEMVDNGFIDEVTRLRELYGPDLEALRAPGYKAFGAYLDGSMTLEQAKNAFIQADIQLAKRQRTWFRRNDSIQWVHTAKEAQKIVARFLNISQ